MSAGDYWIGAAVGALGATLGPFLNNTFNENHGININVPEKMAQQFEQGNGNTVDLYKKFAEKADPVITAGGQSALIEVTVGDKTATFQHVPKAPIVAKPSALEQ